MGAGANCRAVQRALVQVYWRRSGPPASEMNSSKAAGDETLSQLRGRLAKHRYEFDDDHMV
jgi:hypothetical protein